MKDILKSRLANQIVQVLLLIVPALYFITGLGITQFRIVESVTLGLLTKPLAFKMHDYLWVPFVALLLMHIYQGANRSNNP